MRGIDQDIFDSTSLTYAYDNISWDTIVLLLLFSALWYHSTVNRFKVTNEWDRNISGFYYFQWCLFWITFQYIYSVIWHLSLIKISCYLKLRTTICVHLYIFFFLLQVLQMKEEFPRLSTNHHRISNVHLLPLGNCNGIGPQQDRRPCNYVPLVL